MKISPHPKIEPGLTLMSGVPTCSHVAEATQGLKGRVLRKKFVLPIESWFFTFFTFFFYSWFCMMSPSI
jgi:hypothetical protein